MDTGPAPSATCHRFSLGIDVVTAAGSVSRVSFVREKRELFEKGTHHLYRGFVGRTPDGIEVGMPAESASAKLGAPATRRLPVAPRVADDGSIPLEIDDYPKKGFSLEIDLTRNGRVVGAIDVPDADGLPMPTKKENKP
jgi:hypothetical protein